MLQCTAGSTPASVSLAATEQASPICLVVYGRDFTAAHQDAVGLLHRHQGCSTLSAGSPAE
jgi:hypothetical protein